MEILLTIAKFLGLALTTILGVIAVLGKLHEEIEVPLLIQLPGGPETEKRRRLTKWGITTLVGILVGFILGATAQALESINRYRQSRTSQVGIQEQLRIAQTSLDYSQRAVTRLEDLKVFAVFELPASEFMLGDLISEKDKLHFVSTVPSSQQGGKHNVGGLDYGICIAGLKYRPDGTVSTFSGELTMDGINMAVPISTDILERSKKPESIIQDERTSMLQFLHSPKATIRIWRADSDQNRLGGDFTASSAGSQTVSLEYLYPSDHIRLTWACDFPNANWMRNAKMTSLPDLDHASVRLSLDNYPVTQLADPSNARISPDRLRARREVWCAVLKLIFNTLAIRSSLHDLGTAEINTVYATLPGKEDFVPRDLGNYLKSPNAAVTEESGAQMGKNLRITAVRTQ